MAKKLFTKGNKAGKGGLNDPPGGRPTAEQKAFKDRLKEEIERQASKEVEKITAKYVKLAAAATLKNYHTLHHLIDTAIPKAKQEIEVSGTLDINHTTNMPE